MAVTLRNSLRSGPLIVSGMITNIRTQCIWYHGYGLPFPDEAASLSLFPNIRYGGMILGRTGYREVIAYCLTQTEAIAAARSHASSMETHETSLWKEIHTDMGTIRLLNYADKDLDSGDRQKLSGILKADHPAIPDPSGERDRFTHSQKGIYLPFESDLPFLCEFARACEYDFQSEIRVWPDNNKPRIRAIRHQNKAWIPQLCLPDYRKAYAAVNEFTEKKGGFRLFSDPEDIPRCAKEHMRLFTEIPEEEAEVMFGPYKSFSSKDAWKRDGVTDFDRYQRECDEALISRARSGDCKAGDLIGIGFYPHGYGGGSLRSFPWLVLEREGDTALLLSLYACDIARLSQKELGGRKTQKKLEEHLYETLYLTIFQVYPEDKRIIPFPDGARMSLLSTKDAKRLHLESRMKEKALLFPYAAGRCGARSTTCAWLLFAAEEERYPFYEMSNYGLHEVWPKNDAGTPYALRPVLRISCEEVKKSPYR